ncbi:phosphonate ABC transporter ATP-binding protein [Deinococcus peraridilitoris]|uniref:Phosphonate ABC transporter, ATP-binding protein n=1 Tax=Deinococcus peraridilitoris (strain DSM 19664 / LMG 22246 / CIP 109416 / KR-200) TaxID=937777 RepID=K9ZZD1_DEIPD|nr:phosphonate ABC transporter ATP-binding protein [Deinococcus peraridilitoris]AFZ66287.1 phosphonate ABC transporter, ATP-binding protein [Deinococcus peraridilitoris DSM 19664]
MIEVKNLSKIYPNGTVGLDDVNVTIQNGEFVCVIGLSGAGKSTFLRCINRLNDATSGQILIDGDDIAFASGPRLRQLRRRIGFVFQQFNLSTRLSAMENVLSGRLGYHNRFSGVLGLFTAEDRRIAETALTRVGLADRMNVRVDQLSGGQQQRVAIARAVAQQPTLILADEPMASLDPKLSNVIMGILKEFNKDGISVLVNIHVLELALQYADRILGFNKGKLVFDGPPSALSQDEIDRIYSGSVADL